MRYKQLVSDKLEQVVNKLNVLRNNITFNDPNAAKQNIEEVKEKIDEIQTLVNTEFDDNR
jgi:uncharacterized protein YlzI (FlbEa/FlbD family)